MQTFAKLPTTRPMASAAQDQAGGDSAAPSVGNPTAAAVWRARGRPVKDVLPLPAVSGGPSDRAPRRHFEFPQPSVEARIAAAGLAAIIVFLFRKTVFGPGVLFIRDVNMVWLPQVETFVRCVASSAIAPPA